MLMVMKKKEKRSNGTETLKFSREKMDNEKVYREQELEVRKKDIEREGKKEMQERKHQDMVQLMQLQQQKTVQMQREFFRIPSSATATFHGTY